MSWISLLVVDADAAARLRASTWLRHGAEPAFLAADAAAARDALREHPSISVAVVVDRPDRGQDGLRLLEELARERPELVGILAVDPRRGRRVLDAQGHSLVFRCISRSCRGDELRAVVDSAVRRSVLRPLAPARVEP